MSSVFAIIGLVIIVSKYIRVKYYNPKENMMKHMNEIIQEEQRVEADIRAQCKDQLAELDT